MTYLTRTHGRVWGGPSLLTTIYVIIGILAAANRDYFVDVNTVREIASAVLSVLLWPLLLVGIDLHVR